MPRVVVGPFPTVTVEVSVAPGVRTTEVGASVAVNGVAVPTVPAPATMAVRVTVPAKLLRLAMLMTDEIATPTGASSALG